MSDDMPKGLTAEHIDEIWGMIDYHLAYRWDAWGDFRTGLRRLRDEALRATALRAEIERLRGERPEKPLRLADLEPGECFKYPSGGGVRVVVYDLYKLLHFNGNCYTVTVDPNNGMIRAIVNHVEVIRCDLQGNETGEVGGE